MNDAKEELLGTVKRKKINMSVIQKREDKSRGTFAPRNDKREESLKKQEERNRLSESGIRGRSTLLSYGRQKRMGRGGGTDRQDKREQRFE